MKTLNKYISKKVSFKKGFLFKTKHTGTVLFAEIGSITNKLIFTVLVDHSDDMVCLFEDELIFT